MISAPLTKKIIHSFDALSGQLQSAAQFVLDRPHDVALKSMRDQARAANVKPATMTRPVQHLGFQGYDEIRELYAGAIRKGELATRARSAFRPPVKRRRATRP